MDLIREFLIKVFVDNIYLHSFISCHRLPERSFFIQGRQFHICARCTGLLVGTVVSVLLIPAKNYVWFLFPIFLIILVVDGVTQKIRLRQSNNLLRFSTGVTTTSTFIPFIFLLITKLL
jgi:uncharacterized membrane protein